MSPEPNTPRARSSSRIMQRLVAFGLACVGVFCLDALAFRTHGYSSVLEPDSSSGLFELILWREQHAQKRFGDNLVVTLGDSRLGIAPKIANDITTETGYLFRSAGVAGSDPRSWYYMLRDLDPTAHRYRAIVLGVNDYNDEDEIFTPDDDIRALHYCIARFRITDVPEFAASFHDPAIRWQAFRGALFKGLVYQSDFHEFISKPSKRIQYVRLQHHGVEEWTYGYVGNDSSVAGLTIDWNTLTAQFPPGADDNQRGTVQSFLLRAPIPQTGRLAAFRRMWFGKIIDRYRGSRTKVIFLRLARGPIPRPAYLARSTGSVIREFALSRPNVTLADEHAFEALEHPWLFADGMHLNKPGVIQFSTMLAREVGRILGEPR